MVCGNSLLFVRSIMHPLHLLNYFCLSTPAQCAAVPRQFAVNTFCTLHNIQLHHAFAVFAHCCALVLPLFWPAFKGPVATYQRTSEQPRLCGGRLLPPQAFAACPPCRYNNHVPLCTGARLPAGNVLRLSRVVAVRTSPRARPFLLNHTAPHLHGRG